MFSGRLKGVATGNFLNGVQFCESPLGPSCLSTDLSYTCYVAKKLIDSDEVLT